MTHYTVQSVMRFFYCFLLSGYKCLRKNETIFQPARYFQGVSPLV